jgi:hypothetical protein
MCEEPLLVHDSGRRLLQRAELPPQIGLWRMAAASIRTVGNWPNKQATRRGGRSTGRCRHYSGMLEDLRERLAVLVFERKKGPLGGVRALTAKLKIG